MILGGFQGLIPALLDALFWVSLALVPTLAALYALSTSLLGPAVAVARTAAWRLRRTTGAEIERLKELLAAGGDGRQGLRELERRLRMCRAELGTAERASRTLSVRTSVVAPALLFLVTAFLARIPSFGPSAQGPWSAWWLAVLAPFTGGLALLLHTLRTIRSVTELSVPDLEVTVDADPEPWQAGRFHSIRLRALLHRGNVLPQTQLILFLPPECAIRGAPIWTVPADDPVMPGFRALGSAVWDYRALAPFEWEFHHLEPLRSGPLTFYYAVYGGGFTTQPTPIRVNVS